jgi:hypothetical protein
VFILVLRCILCAAQTAIALVLCVLEYRDLESTDSAYTAIALLDGARDAEVLEHCSSTSKQS